MINLFLERRSNGDIKRIFDLDLDVMTSYMRTGSLGTASFFGAQQLINQLPILVNEYPDIIGNQQNIQFIIEVVDALNSSGKQFDDHPHMCFKAERRDLHPFAYIATFAHKYVALLTRDTHKNFGAHIQPCLNLMRAVLINNIEIVSHTNSIEISKQILLSCKHGSEFSNIWKQLKLNELVNKHDYAGALKAINHLKHDEFIELRPLTRALKKSLAIAQKIQSITSGIKSKPIRSPDPDPPPIEIDDEDPIELIQPEPDGSDDQDIEDPPVIIVTGGDTETTEPLLDPPEPPLKKHFKRAARYDSQITLSGLHSGQSEDVLTAHECLDVMNILLHHIPSTRNENIARTIWVISGAMAIRPAILLRSFSEMGQTHPTHLNHKAILKNDTIEVWYDHPESGLPSAPPNVTTLCEHAFDSERRICRTLNIEGLPFDTSILSDLKNIEDDSEDAELILQAIRDIGSMIKGRVRRCTQYRFAFSLLQPIFNATNDFAVLQLISGERLGHSMAHLHYIAYPQAQIDSIQDEAREHLFPGIFPKTQTLYSNWIGAPKGMISLSNLDSLKDISILGARPNRHSSIKEICDYHNRFVSFCSHLLALSTASRNLIDFDELTFSQFSLTHNLVIFEDKRSDPSCYRRAPVLSTSCCNAVHAYGDHLQKLRTRLTGTHSNVLNFLEDVLASRKPMFFSLDTNESKIEPRSWSIKTEMKHLFSDDTPYNFYRPIISTQLRQIDWKMAPFIEAHLGHTIGLMYVNNESTISWLEYKNAMLNLLDVFFDQLGIQISRSSNSHFKIDLFQQLPSKLAQQITSTYKDDFNELKAQIAVESQNGTSIQQLIVDEIKQSFEVEHLSQIPDNAVIDNELSKSIFRKTESLAKNYLQLNNVIRKTRIFLKNLAAEKNWGLELHKKGYAEIGTPIEITRFHLRAAEELEELRKRLWATFNINNTGHVIWLLLLYGGAHSIQMAKSVINNLDKSFCFPEEGILVINTLHSLDQAHAVSGISAVVLLELKLQNVSLKRINSTKALGPLLNVAWSDDEIDEFFSLAFSLEYPPLLNRLHTRRIISRTLPYERFIELISDSHNASRQLISHQEKQSLGDTLATSSYALVEKEYKALKSCFVLNSEQRPEKTNPVITDKIDQLLAQFEGSQFGYSLHLWAKILLKPHANIRSGKYLKSQTVSKYLHLIFKFLTPVFVNKRFEDIGSEELLDEIDDQLYLIYDADIDKDQVEVNEAKTTINRYIKEICLQMQLPQVFVPSSSQDKTTDPIGVDANLILPAEFDWIERVIKHYRDHPNTNNQELAAFNRLLDLINIGEMHGPRTNELVKARGRDFSTQSPQILSIAPHAQRSIKTTSGIRPLELLNVTIDTEGKIDEFPFQDAFKNEHVRFDSLHLLNNLIKKITLDERGRYYWSRHYAANAKLIKAISLGDPFTRHQQFQKIKMEMGHKSLDTTLGSYTHTSPLLIGVITTKHIQISSANLARVRGVSRVAANKFFGTSLESLPKVYARSNNLALVPVSNVEIPVLIDELASSPNHLYEVLMHFNYFYDCIYNTNKNIHLSNRLKLFLIHLKDAQAIHGWELIPSTLLTTLINDKSIGHSECLYKPHFNSVDIIRWSKAVKLLTMTATDELLTKFSKVKENVSIGPRILGFKMTSIVSALDMNLLFDELKTRLVIKNINSEFSISCKDAKAHSTSTSKAKILLLIVASSYK